MELFMTGATGYLGTAAAEALAADGHRVFGLARSDDAARALEQAGHTPVRGDLRKPASLGEPARDAEGVVHVAHAGGDDAGAVDRAAVEAMLDAMEGTAKPFLYTSGVWVVGDTGEEVADENRPLEPAELVRWRAEFEPRVLDAAERDVRTVVLRPAIVYGRGGGISGSMVAGAEEDGAVEVVGDGRQEWSAVHVEDLADLYALALRDGEAGRLYQAAHGPFYAVRDVALAACVAAGRDPAVVERPLEEARREMGAVADALALTQRVSGARARGELGWSPSRPTLLEELLRGSYRG